MKAIRFYAKYILFALLITNCNSNTGTIEEKIPVNCQEMLGEFKTVEILIDTAALSNSEKKMISLFNEISDITDQLFWYQSYGHTNAWSGIGDTCLKKLLEINFGPWNRFRKNEPFIDSVGKKPLGANLYPADLSKEEFNSWTDSLKKSPYTYIRRNSKGELISVPYSCENKLYIQKMSVLFQKAADLTDDKEFKDYLLKRALGFLTDEYLQSDKAWLKTKNNSIGFIAGPIEIYDDKLFGYKAEFESFLYIKDTILTKKYEKYALMLPFLQKALPVEIKYRHEDPEMISGLLVCDILKFGGCSKAGGYNLSLTYPSETQGYGTKNQANIQFKNVLDLKYEHIFYPTAKIILDDIQVSYINNEAYFQNNIFFELGLRMGIKNVLSTGETVRHALKEYATVFQLLKAYTFSLYIAEKLSSVGEIKKLESNYTCALVDIFRVSRFESSSAYAKAKIILFNYLKSKKAIKRNSAGKYSLEFDKVKPAIDELIQEIIMIQGDGNYKKAGEFLEDYLNTDETFYKDLIQIAEYQQYKDIYIKP